MVCLADDLCLQRPNYETWLNQIVAVYQTHLDNKDRTFSRFLLDLPAVPLDVLNLLRDMCIEPDRCASYTCWESTVIICPRTDVK